MAINLDAIRGKLNKLQNTNSKQAGLWKPTPGKHTIRIVPYKFDTENPFIELYFHYNINNKSYLSPSSFGRPDPIVEFAEKLKRMGNKEDYSSGRKMEPKLRTYVPVLVRGEENEGVRFWGFGKTVYQDILGYISDPDYGDITDPEEGRDIVVDIVSAEDSGTSYPVTTIRVKPKESPLAGSHLDVKKFLENQTKITDIYEELSYAELKNVLEQWLNPGAPAEDGASASISELSSKPATNTASTPIKSANPNINAFESEASTNEKKRLDDVASAFDDLFG
jgi:hypothetical protein